MKKLIPLKILRPRASWLYWKMVLDWERAFQDARLRLWFWQAAASALGLFDWVFFTLSFRVARFPLTMRYFKWYNGKFLTWSLFLMDRIHLARRGVEIFQPGGRMSD